MSKPLEIHVMRVVKILLGVIWGYLAFAWEVPLLGVVSAVMFLACWVDQDYRSARRWWVSLVAFAACGAVLAFFTFVDSSALSARWTADWWSWLAMTAAFFVKLIAQLTGRVRRVWSFARSPV